MRYGYIWEKPNGRRIAGTDITFQYSENTKECDISACMNQDHTVLYRAEYRKKSHKIVVTPYSTNGEEKSVYLSLKKYEDIQQLTVDTYNDMFLVSTGFRYILFREWKRIEEGKMHTKSLPYGIEADIILTRDNIYYVDEHKRVVSLYSSVSYGEHVLSFDVLTDGIAVRSFSDRIDVYTFDGTCTTSIGLGDNTCFGICGSVHDFVATLDYGLYRYNNNNFKVYDMYSCIGWKNPISFKDSVVTYQTHTGVYTLDVSKCEAQSVITKKSKDYNTLLTYYNLAIQQKVAYHCSSLYLYNHKNIALFPGIHNAYGRGVYMSASAQLSYIGGEAFQEDMDKYSPIYIIPIDSKTRETQHSLNSFHTNGRIVYMKGIHVINVSLHDVEHFLCFENTRRTPDSRPLDILLGASLHDDSDKAKIIYADEYAFIDEIPEFSIDVVNGLLSSDEVINILQEETDIHFRTFEDIINE